MNLGRMISLGAVMAASASPALAQPVPLEGPPSLTPAVIFMDAALPIQAVVFLLLAGAAGAVVVTIRKLARGGPIVGGSAYLSALRLGAPLLGLLGAAYGAMNMFIGIAHVDRDLPLAIVAPGIVEAIFTILIGLLVGFIAVICNWAVESRVDRDVLRA